MDVTAGMAERACFEEAADSRPAGDTLWVVDRFLVRATADTGGMGVCLNGVRCRIDCGSLDTGSEGVKHVVAERAVFGVATDDGPVDDTRGVAGRFLVRAEDGRAFLGDTRVVVVLCFDCFVFMTFVLRSMPGMGNGVMGVTGQMAHAWRILRAPASLPRVPTY
jgi:hypothetical protein